MFATLGQKSLRRPNRAILNPDCRRAEGLIGWWPMNPGVNVWNPGHPNNPGTTTGGCTFSGTGGFGGSMAVLNGTTGYIQTATALGLTYTSPFSLAVWAYATSSGAGRMLIGSAPESGNYDGIWLLWGGAGTEQTRFTLVDTITHINYVQSTTTKSLGTYYRLMCTYDGSASLGGMKIYENGIAAGLTSSSSTFGSFTDRAFRIGCDTAGVDFFPGFLFDACIWNRTLTADEAWSDFDPKTRWDLYWQPKRTWFLNPAAAPGGTIPLSPVFTAQADNSSRAFTGM